MLTEDELSRVARHLQANIDYDAKAELGLEPRQWESREREAFAIKAVLRYLAQCGVRLEGIP